MEAPRRPRTPIGWFFRLRAREPSAFRRSPRALAHPHPWPQGRGFDPATNPVFAHNAIVLPDVTPAAAFEAVARPADWSRYYENAELLPPGAPPPALHLDACFEFRTFATRQRCRVLEYEAPFLLGWEARMPGNRAYHRWLFEPVDGGTRVVTEECNTGLLAHLNPVMSEALHAAHGLWLSGLAAHLAATQRR